MSLIISLIFISHLKEIIKIKDNRILYLKEILNKNCDEEVVAYNLQKLDNLSDMYNASTMEGNRSFKPGTGGRNVDRIKFVDKFPEYEHLYRPYKK